MRMVILTMRDSKAGIYMQPFAALTIQTAVRDITDILNAQGEKNIPWVKFPTDFDLYRTAVFDDATGKVETQEPEFLMNLGSLKAA